MNYTALKKIKYLAFIAIFLILAARKAIAQSTIPLTVSPARQTIQVDPGSTEKTTITFFNRANLPIAGNIKVVDFIVKDNTGAPFLLEGMSVPTKYSAASWITTSQEKAVIAANDSVKINITIKVPENASPGGRYAAVYFEPTGILPNVREFVIQKEGEQLTTSRLVGLMNIRVNGPITEEAAIKKFEVPSFLEYGPVVARAEIYNNGSYHITPRGKITLAGSNGKIIEEYTLEEKNIFPENSRVYETALGEKMMIGKFNVSLLAMYGDSNQVLSAKQVIWIFPWKITLATLLAVIITVLTVVLIAKKIKSRQKELEEKLEKEISEIEKLKSKFKDTTPPKK